MSKNKETLKNLAMVDVAYELLKASSHPIAIQELFKQIAEIKEIPLDDVTKLTQLYMDITQSAKFVFCGDDKWDLKEGNLHLWDDDGSSFIEITEEDEEEVIEVDLSVFDEEEDEEEVIFDDEDEDDELDEEAKEAIKEEQEYIDVGLPLQSTDDDDVDFDADDYDEDDYNKIMDNYEDMYDE
ncbi:MAG TPA: DNA-directed RNA polymerase subunit delta [Haploplasma sp.]|nr:DNA-directed RNA polymerase subunit delta [Haploplasma sp.]